MTEVTIRLKYIRHSARKLGPILKQFRGQNLEKSIDKLAVYPQDSARFLRQALKSAKSAAQEKSMDLPNLVLTVASATPGPKLKRIRANARGRTNRYQKHLAHLIVSVATAKKPKGEKK